MPAHAVEKLNDRGTFGPDRGVPSDGGGDGAVGLLADRRDVAVQQPGTYVVMNGLLRNVEFGRGGKPALPVPAHRRLDGLEIPIQHRCAA